MFFNLFHMTSRSINLLIPFSNEYTIRETSFEPYCVLILKNFNKCWDYLSLYLAVYLSRFSYSITQSFSSQPGDGGKTTLVCLNNVILSLEYSFLVEFKCKYIKWFITILSYANASVAPK